MTFNLMIIPGSVFEVSKVCGSINFPFAEYHNERTWKAVNEPDTFKLFTRLFSDLSTSQSRTEASREPAEAMSYPAQAAQLLLPVLVRNFEYSNASSIWASRRTVPGLTTASPLWQKGCKFRVRFT